MKDIATRPSEAVERSLYPAIGLYIGGEWIYDREPWCQVRNPAPRTRQAPCLRPRPRTSTGRSARRRPGAGGGAIRLPPRGCVIILRAVALLRQRARDIAKVLTLENGKTLAAAEAEIERCGNFYEWDAAQSLRNYRLGRPGRAAERS